MTILPMLARMAFKFLFTAVETGVQSMHTDADERPLHLIARRDAVAYLQVGLRAFE